MRNRNKSIKLYPLIIFIVSLIYLFLFMGKMRTLGDEGIILDGAEIEEK